MPTFFGGFSTIAKLVKKRKVKFMQSFSVICNSLCILFKAEAEKEIQELCCSVEMAS